MGEEVLSKGESCWPSRIGWEDVLGRMTSTRARRAEVWEAEVPVIRFWKLSLDKIDDKRIVVGRKGER